MENSQDNSQMEAEYAPHLAAHTNLDKLSMFLTKIKLTYIEWKRSLRNHAIVSPQEMINIKSVGGLLSHMNFSVSDQKSRDERIATEMYEKIQLLDLLIFMLVTLGLALCTLSYNLEFQNTQQFFSFSFLLINMGFSVVCCIFIVMSENLKLKMDQNRGRADKADNLTTTGRIKFVIGECALLMVIPYPFLIGIEILYFNEAVRNDIYYHINDFLYLASLLRFVYFSKSILNITIWKSRSASRICKMYGCQPGIEFSIRCMMKENPSQLNFFLLCLDVFFFTLAIRIAEAPLSRVVPTSSMFEYSNCIWLVSMTTTTAGYGDVYPKTPLGKFIMFWCSMAGVIIVSLIIVTITNMLEMSVVESKAFSVVQKTILKKQLKEKAAVVITKASKLWKNLKNKEDIASYRVVELSNQIEKFKKQKMKYQNEKEEGAGQIQEVFREFEILGNTNKEMKLNLSILACMVQELRTEISQLKKQKKKPKVNNIGRILIDSVKKNELHFIKQQLLMRDYVSIKSMSMGWEN